MTCYAKVQAHDLVRLYTKTSEYALMEAGENQAEGKLRDRVLDYLHKRFGATELTYRKGSTSKECPTVVYRRPLYFVTFPDAAHMLFFAMSTNLDCTTVDSIPGEL